ncbi:hypothetical protein M3M33_05210 [Loigolactobacillus coryniformis]|uniref:hypothetical protein n=1 Tax=Loigolactobacillus coryniformis TaxID=1610 RepID=UPI00201A3E08|nr:hypothetical protein [Loigolactobacillus coryniformis]MCL5458071.1 hypothetical protein [Loigolactobacillus coryniformis]
MSNETKWDVFKIAMKYAAKSGWLDYDDMINRYDDALPDDLPVIPKAVGEILRSAYGQTNLLGVLDTAKNGYKFSETLAWIIAYQNTFASAWVLGIWRVEETGEIVKLEAEK